MLETFGGDAAPSLERHVLAAGFVPARHSYAMVRPHLDDLPDAPLPEGLEIRPVLPEHRRAVWDAAKRRSRRLGRDREHRGRLRALLTDRPGLTPRCGRSHGTATRSRAKSARTSMTRRTRGSAASGATPSTSSWRRPSRRRGLARALIAASFPALRARGMQEAALGVDTENVHGALRLYEGCGFRPVQPPNDVPQAARLGRGRDRSTAVSTGSPASSGSPDPQAARCGGRTGTRPLVAVGGGAGSRPGTASLLARQDNASATAGSSGT